MFYLQEYVSKGLISARKHPKYDLWVTNYTPKVQYEALWDDVTLSHRGKVVDGEGNVVSSCLPKFFNYQEHQSPDTKLDPVPLTGDFMVQEKIDGSMILVTNHASYDELIISSRGSFESDQVAWAKEIIDERGYEFPDGYTFMFELVHPENRIVVDYGNKRDLILLTRFLPDDREVPLFDYDKWSDDYVDQFPHAEYIDAPGIEHLLEDDRDNFEGYVVFFENGLRVKVKLDEYVRLHAIVTHLSSKKVFEATADGSIEDLIKELPDEHFGWVREEADTFNELFEGITNTATLVAEDVKKRYPSDRKSQAQYILKHHTEIASLVFNCLDNRDLDTAVWKHLHKNINFAQRRQAEF